MRSALAKRNARLIEKLTDEPQTLTELGSQTGYPFHDLVKSLQQLQRQGRAVWSETGWVRGKKNVSA